MFFHTPVNWVMGANLAAHVGQSISELRGNNLTRCQRNTQRTFIKMKLKRVKPKVHYVLAQPRSISMANIEYAIHIDFACRVRETSILMQMTSADRCPSIYVNPWRVGHDNFYRNTINPGSRRPDVTRIWQAVSDQYRHHRCSAVQAVVMVTMVKIGNVQFWTNINT